jgi:hypothetical protein
MPSLHEYRQRPHWCYSSLNQLLNICSLQWFFQRIERLPAAFTPLPLAFGSAYHRVMEFVALSRQDGTVPSAPDTRDLFNEVWKRQVAEDGNIAFGDKADAESCADQGMEMCAAYLEQIDPEEQVVGVSEVFAVPVGSSELPLVGELDCVTARLDELTVIDWKTSGRRWPKDQADKSAQATTYLYAYRQLHPDEDPGFRFDVAVKNKTPVIEKHTTTRDGDDFLRLEALVAKAELIVKHQLYYPADGSMYCGGCPFQEPCRAWHRDRTISAAA